MSYIPSPLKPNVETSPSELGVYALDVPEKRSQLTLPLKPSHEHTHTIASRAFQHCKIVLAHPSPIIPHPARPFFTIDTDVNVIGFSIQGILNQFRDQLRQGDNYLCGSQPSLCGLWEMLQLAGRCHPRCAFLVVGGQAHSANAGAYRKTVTSIA